MSSNRSAQDLMVVLTTPRPHREPLLLVAELFQYQASAEVSVAHRTLARRRSSIVK